MAIPDLPTSQCCCEMQNQLEIHESISKANFKILKKRKKQFSTFFFQIESDNFLAKNPNSSVAFYWCTSILSRVLCKAHVVFNFNWCNFG